VISFRTSAPGQDLCKFLFAENNRELANLSFGGRPRLKTRSSPDGALPTA
jgi:hypothetical protein